MKEDEDFLLKKGTSKVLRVSDPTRISPFVLPTRKEAPTGNAPMGAIPHTAVIRCFSSSRGKQNFRGSKGSFFRPHNRGKGRGSLFPMTPQASTSRRSPPFFQQRLANKQLFIQRIKPYYQWLRTAIPLKAQLGQFSLIISEYKALPKDQALAHCIQSLLSKNVIERVENVKSLGFYSRLFLVPKPHQRWRPVIDLSRLNTFLHVEKF